MCAGSCVCWEGEEGGSTDPRVKRVRSLDARVKRVRSLDARVKRLGDSR